MLIVVGAQVVANFGEFKVIIGMYRQMVLRNFELKSCETASGITWLAEKHSCLLRKRMQSC